MYMYMYLLVLPFRRLLSRLLLLQDSPRSVVGLPPALPFDEPSERRRLIPGGTVLPPLSMCQYDVIKALAPELASNNVTELVFLVAAEPWTAQQGPLHDEELSQDPG